MNDSSLQFSHLIWSQIHAKAVYRVKMKKEHGQIKLNLSTYKNSKKKYIAFVILFFVLLLFTCG
ncbi:hypothetical protein CHH55_07515 [Niallia circulans]|nr:hypothetical protein CHH55_07515 [Niallia circulans]